MEGQYTWMFEVRTGRFFEQWRSPQLSTSLGWNGNPNASVWDANMQGKVRLLDLDDLEVSTRHDTRALPGDQDYWLLARSRWHP